jgi:hypothetical protein
MYGRLSVEECPKIPGPTAWRRYPAGSPRSWRPPDLRMRTRWPRCPSRCTTRPRRPTAARWSCSGAPATTSPTGPTGSSRCAGATGWTCPASRTPGRRRRPRSPATNSSSSVGRTPSNWSPRPRSSTEARGPMPPLRSGVGGVDQVGGHADAARKLWRHLHRRPDRGRRWARNRRRCSTWSRCTTSPTGSGPRWPPCRRTSPEVVATVANTVYCIGGANRPTHEGPIATVEALDFK